MNVDQLKHLRSMRNQSLNNYIVPGLMSSLVGGRAPDGSLVRLFEASRTQHESITPHSHRFNFMCWVIRGSVTNRIWTRAPNQDPSTHGDQYVATNLVYDGEPGRYKLGPSDHAWKWTWNDRTYTAGDWYSMKHMEVHSIVFSADAIVLFFEGPTVTDTVRILEPSVNGMRVETFMVKPWMFRPLITGEPQ